MLRSNEPYPLWSETDGARSRSIHFARLPGVRGRYEGLHGFQLCWRNVAGTELALFVGTLDDTSIVELSDWTPSCEGEKTTISLETDRLILRNFRPDDWEGLQAVIVAYQASDSAQYEPPWPTSDEKAREIAGWFAGGDDYLAVCLKDSGTLIGLVAIGRHQDQEQQIHNLGYVFHPGYGGPGYATESCRAAMSYLFDELGVEGILTGTHPENKPSIALLKRLGLHEVDGGEWTLSQTEWSGS